MSAEKKSTEEQEEQKDEQRDQIDSPDFSKRLFRFLIVLFIILSIIFIFVVFDIFSQKIFTLLGITVSEVTQEVEPTQKSEALRFLGIGMGGILFVLQVVASHRRAKAMEAAAKDQAKATEQQANVINVTEKGQRQERLKTAIDHLANKSISVRLGGAYELFHLAKETEELRDTILDILCAHIRWTTGEREYQKKNDLKPSEEVQSLLTLLFKKGGPIFKDLHVNLQESFLKGANFFETQLQRANLVRAQLQGANLNVAQLQGAYLIRAQLQEADLIEAQLQGAYLIRIQLQGANLSRAQLQGAYLIEAQLQEADLIEAQLQGADLSFAELQGANLSHAELQGTNLKGLQVQAAILYEVNMKGAGNYEWENVAFFEDHMNESVGNKGDLSNVIFEGGLNQEDVERIIEDLSDEKATELREKLQAHVGQPEIRGKPPKGAVIHTGAYTQKEADAWIAASKKSISTVPKRDNT